MCCCCILLYPNVRVLRTCWYSAVSAFATCALVLHFCVCLSVLSEKLPTRVPRVWLFRHSATDLSEINSSRTFWYVLYGALQARHRHIEIHFQLE